MPSGGVSDAPEARDPRGYASDDDDSFEEEAEAGGNDEDGTKGPGTYMRSRKTAGETVAAVPGLRTSVKPRIFTVPHSLKDAPGGVSSHHKGYFQMKYAGPSDASHAAPSAADSSPDLLGARLAPGPTATLGLRITKGGNELSGPTAYTSKDAPVAVGSLREALLMTGRIKQ